MVAVLKDSPEYAKIFGTKDFEKFVSEFPPYSVVQVAVNDPAVRRDAGLSSADAMMGMLCKDLQAGSRSMVWKLAVTTGDFASNANINLPSRLMPGLEQLINSAAIGDKLTAREVTDVVLATAADPKAGAKVAGKVVLGVALAAVGTAVPLIGTIGAAVVAFVGALIGLLKSKQPRDPMADPAVRAELYKQFPPLQVQDGDLDAELVNKALLPAMVSQDWTGIYLPRFTGDWVGLERLGGFAFARGQTKPRSTNFGEEIQTFVASPDGLGVLPGTNQCTSVLQISLDPAGAEMAQFFIHARNDPRRRPGAADRVVDTGGFYLALGRLAGLAWDWATRPDSPYQYRLDCLRMHAAWREHTESGIEFIKEVVFPWFGLSNDQGRIRGSANLEGFYGSAVFAAVGSWACSKTGGTNHHPVFKLWADTYGLPADQIPVQPTEVFPGSRNAGAFLPILDPPTKAFQGCMSTIYERTPAIRTTLDALQRQQRYALRNSLVAAYVRSSDAAFAGDPKLLELLNTQRALLLQHEDRKAIDLRDVPHGESWNGEDWRGALIKSGVPPKPSAVAAVGLKFAGADDPPPTVPPVQAGPPVPWLARPVDRGDSSLPVVLGSAGVALGAAWWWRVRRRRKNFVDLKNGGLS